MNNKIDVFNNSKVQGLIFVISHIVFISILYVCCLSIFNNNEQNLIINMFFIFAFNYIIEPMLKSDTFYLLPSKLIKIFRIIRICIMISFLLYFLVYIKNTFTTDFK